MAENNEILQLFEIFGKVGIDIRETVKNLTTVTEKAEDAAKDITRTFKNLERDVSNIELSANVDTDSAVAEIERFKQQTRDMMRDIEADATIAVDSEQALKDLRRLEGQLNRMQIKVQSGDFSEATGAQRQRERVQETMTTIRENVNVTESRTVEQRFLSEIARNMQQVVTNTNSDTVQQVHEQAINNAAQQQQTQQEQAAGSGIGGEHVAAAVLAERLLDGVGGDGRRNGPAYDLDRQQAREQRYQEKMLRYAQKLTAQFVLPRVTQSLDRGRSAIPYFNDAKNMMQAQTTFGMIESGVTSARSRLAQLGYGRTKQEIKAMQGQMYTLANTRLDNLNDQIKLTEKALKDMKNASNAHEYTEQIKDATNALKLYKDEVKELNVAQKAAETEGYKVGKFGGKKVIYDEYSSTLEKLSGKFGAFLTKDIALALNRSYNKLDSAGIDIAGDQGTKALNKAKMMQLATSFQTLGTTMMMVAPALGILTAGVAAFGATADEAVSSMQRQTLVTDAEMEKYRDGMGRVQVNTGASREDISKVFVDLERQGYSGNMLERKAETGLNFNKAFDIEATDAIKAVEDIEKKLGVTEDSARNILTLALDEYNGDLKTAQKEVLEHKKHWKEIKDTQIDGMKSYEKMTEGSMTTWEKMVRAAQSWGNVLDELWERFGEVLDPILDKITAIGNATAEWMQEHPNATKWIATLGVLTTAFAALSALLLPAISFIIMNRTVFQALGQSLGLMGKGMAVVNPQAKMLLDSMTLMRNGLLGMPRLIGAIGPALFGLFRSLPLQLGQMLGTFMRLNPLLTVFGALFLLIYRNIDEYQPVFDRIGDALGRIIKSIAKAFGGDASTTTSAFTSIIDKLADVTADVLVPAFELLASLLEMIAPLMENGGGKVVAFVGGLLLLASVLGGVAKGIGGLKGAFAVLISPLTGLISLLGKLKSLWPGGKSKIDVKQTKTTKNIQKTVPGTVRTTPYVGKTPTMVPVGGGADNVASQTVRAGKVTVHGSPVYVDGKIAGKQDIRGDKTRNTTVVPANIPTASNEPSKNSKKPKYTTTRNNHDEIPDEIRTKGDKGKSGGIGWKSILAGLVGGELIEAMLDLNTKKAEKNLTSFLEDMKGQIDDLGGGGDEGASLRDNIENLLNGDLSDIDMDGITEIKEQVTEEMKGIFGDDVFNRISNKTPGKFKKMFGVIGKVVGRMAGFLTGPIGGILLTLIPLIWEFREPIMKALKKFGEYLPEGLVNGIKAGWKWLKGIGKWFYDKVIAPVKKAFGIASPSRVMAQIGRWIVRGLVNGIKNAIGLLKKVVSWIVKPFKALPGAMRKVLSSVKNAFTRVFSAIYRSVRVWMIKARSIAIRLTRALASGVRNAIRSLASFFARIFKAIYQTVAKWLGAARDFAISAMRKMRNFITKVLTYLRDLFASIFKKIFNTVSKWLTAMWNFVTKIFNKIKSFIGRTLRSVLATVTKMFRAMFDSAKKWLGKVWDKVTDIFGAIKRYLVKTARDANSWGSDIIMGIWEGMKDKAESMLGWITELGESIADLFKKAMGIHSPSRVMRAIAKWIPIGVGLGINDGAKDVKKATRGMSDTIVKSFKPKLTTDDIMNGIVKSKQSNMRKLNLSVASAKTSSVRGSNALGGITVQNMTVNNNTERAARGFHETTQTKLDREVRRKMR